MIKIWGWDKKPRTMLRYIKIGDIFCFKFDDHTYCFGRIMAKVIFHIAEIFDYTSDQPIITEKDIRNVKRLIAIPLDTYSLFDRKTEGAWRIIGHQENYTPEHVEDIWFSWGIGSGCRKSNIFDHTVSISEEEWNALPSLSPSGDYCVKRKIADRLKL
ncbi:MAG: immunity 26/phosphotriesterase HocA family protein [Lachnospiraceae bacterium]